MPPSGPPFTSTYVVTRRLFLRLLGLVYLLAFVSLATQIVGLVGERGILPAGRFLAWAHSTYGGESYRQLPTLFWLGADDNALRLAAWAGVALSAALVFGVAPVTVLFLLWALYLSLSVVGQDFLSFQWDALLLETGLLAMLWAPMTWRLGRSERPPPELARLLLVFLLFKLMFLSGATKILSGDPTWRGGTALDFHFETQPLPPWTAWYAHQMPAGVHQGLTVLTLVVEVLVPWLLLLPGRLRPLRIGAAAAIALFQLGIAATGNFGFFNALAIVLCVPLLDDAALARLRLRPRPSEDARTTQPRLGRTLLLLAFPVLLGLSALSLVRELAFTAPGGRGLRWWPLRASVVMDVVAPLRSINGYGLFRVMTIDRPELVLEGSSDGTRWKEYDFRFKPDAPGERPRFVAPFHPRLDWQLWFAALAPAQSLGWLETLADRLRAGTPEVLALLGRNPFPGGPPRYLRAVLYDYRFSTPEERRRTGAWWVRTPQGVVPLGAQP